MELEIEVSAFLFPYRPRATLSLPLLPSIPLSFATLASFPLLAFSQSKVSPKARARRLPPAPARVLWRTFCAWQQLF